MISRNLMIVATLCIAAAFITGAPRAIASGGITFETAEQLYVNSKYEQAVTLLTSLASAGNAQAANRLGDCYEYGHGVTKNLPKARLLYEQAIKLGSDDALDSLGRMYRDGLGVTRDDKKAADLFKQAADQWVARGAYDLSEMYRWGRGTNMSYKLYLAMLERSANQGLPEAEHDLAHLYVHGSEAPKFYLDGIAVPKDRQKALELFERAARFGWADPANDVGNLYGYENGVDGKPDYKEAFKWHLRAAEGGNRYGEREVADAYLKGRGVDADARKSSFWAAKAIAQFRKEAIEGNLISQFDLGRMYQNGLGVPIDNWKARYWYEKAAAHGNPHACNMLALLLWDCPPAGKNQIRAVALWKQGARGGCPYAQYNLARHYDVGGPGTKQNSALAAYWYRIAADRDNFRAAYYLAQHYENGIGVAKNIPSAVHYYEIAKGDADQKIVDASKNSIESLKRAADH
jgi:hypothetical protein